MSDETRGRDGTIEGPSDNVHADDSRGNPTPGEIPSELPRLEKERYTPDEVGVLLGVQGQRIRQLLRQYRIGTKDRRQWTLSRDDVTLLVSQR